MVEFPVELHLFLCSSFYSNEHTFAVVSMGVWSKSFVYIGAKRPTTELKSWPSIRYIKLGGDCVPCVSKGVIGEAWRPSAFDRYLHVISIQLKHFPKFSKQTMNMLEPYLIKSKKESKFRYGLGFAAVPVGSSFLPGLIDETSTMPKMAAESVVVR